MKDHDGLDDKLQQLYRKLPKVEPDPALDEQILNAARQQSPRPWRWQQPFALAASVVMVGTLLLYWRVEQPLQLERALSVAKESAPAPAAPVTVPETKMATAQQPVAMDSAKLEASADDAGHYAAKAKIAANKHQEEFDQLATIPARGASEKKMLSYGSGSASSQAGLTLKDEKTIAVLSANQGQEQERQKQDEAVMAAPATASAPEPAESMPPAAPAISAMGGAVTAKADGANTTDKPAELRTDSTVRPQALAKRARPAAAAEALAQPAKAKPVSALTSIIEGVSLGMSLEQLQSTGFSCGNDVCRKQLSAPVQAAYWAIPSLNARFKVFLSHNLAYKLVLEQTAVDIATVQSTLEQSGQATDKVCLEEKGEMLVKREMQGMLIHLQRQGESAILTLCADH